MNDRKNVTASNLSADAVARAFREQSAEHERLYRESEVRATLSLQLKLLREGQKLSQAELAVRIGRKQPFIARLEKGGYDRCELSTLRTVLRAMSFDLNFERLVKKLPEPIFTGHSSCENLEMAFEVDEAFTRTLADYSAQNWSLVGAEPLKLSTKAIAPDASDRRLRAAA